MREKIKENTRTAKNEKAVRHEKNQNLQKKKLHVRGEHGSSPSSFLHKRDVIAVHERVSSGVLFEDWEHWKQEKHSL